MSSTRWVKESPVSQGTNERVAYIFGWSTVGTPVFSAVTLYDMATMGTLSAATYMSGAASVSGTDVTTPLIINLEAGKRYLLNCAVTVAGNLLSANCEIDGEV